jgi:hypothetical protein
MRYEAIWIAQFIGMVGLLALVFLVGVAVGRRWPSRRSGPDLPPPDDAVWGAPARRTELFAPEFARVVDLRDVDAWSVPELPTDPAGERDG